MSQQQILLGAGGGGDPVYVDDLFSCTQYNGTGSSHTITNNIDLSGEGGLVWLKRRDGANSNVLYDTERGANKYLSTNMTAAQYTASSQQLTAFNSNGFTLGTDHWLNGSDREFASWTFRKAEKFFDCLTYTGNGTTGRTVSHNLGSVPGMMIIKKVNNSENWIVYHRTQGATKHAKLNNTSVFTSQTNIFNNTEPTSSVFTLGANSQVNESGDTYVAYLFAHDESEFGENQDESIIYCGSYTGNGSSNGPFVNIGFQPQWIMFKNASQGYAGWYLHDEMRGMAHGNNDALMYADLNNAEGYPQENIRPNATGFQIVDRYQGLNGDGHTVTFIAIGRHHKPPENGTDVFTADNGGPNAQANQPTFESSHTVDLCIHKHRTSSSLGCHWFDRMRAIGGVRFKAENNNAEDSVNNFHYFDTQPGTLSGTSGGNMANYVGWLFKRAKGFFDMQCYEGNSTAGRTLNHNLGAVPHFMVIKRRDAGTSWYIYHKDLGAQNLFQGWDNTAPMDIDTILNDTAPTSSVITLGNSSHVNGSNDDYIVYLWGSVDGVCKIGSYTGTGSSGLNVDCGFTSGARFVMLKRHGSGDWFIFDTSRGINSGADPYINMNGTNPQYDADYIDPYNAGFQIGTSSATINANGDTFYFIAIA